MTRICGARRLSCVDDRKGVEHGNVIRTLSASYQGVRESVTMQEFIRPLVLSILKTSRPRRCSEESKKAEA